MEPTTSPQSQARCYDDYGDDYGSKKKPVDSRIRSQTEKQVIQLYQVQPRRSPAKGAHVPAASRGPGSSPSPRQGSEPVIRHTSPQATESKHSPSDGTIAPHNNKFVTPIFPQVPITVTSSNNVWAIMLEQACQTFEAILGPFLEAVLCECTTMDLMPADSVNLSPRISLQPTRASAPSSGYGDSGGSPGVGTPPALHGADSGALSDILPHPPYAASTCLDLLLRHKWLCHNKFPVTMRKRLEASWPVVATLSTAPDTLSGDAVLTAEQAMRSIVQDCLKAMGLPSLLGAGSRQFISFVRQARPEFENQLLYLDVLIADCQETMQEVDSHRAAQERCYH